MQATKTQPIIAAMARSAIVVVLLGCSDRLPLSSQAAVAQAVSNEYGGTSPSASPTELVFWQSVAESGDPIQLASYLEVFPQGVFADLARAKIAALPEALRRTDPAEAQGAAHAGQTPGQTQDRPQGQGQAQGASPVLATVAPAALTTATLAKAGSDPKMTTPFHAVALDTAFVEQLRAMALAQGNRYQLREVMVPARPALPSLEPLELSDSFCSEVERNAFFATHYKPAIDRAGEGNTLAIAHMELLKRMFDEAIVRGDSNLSNTLAQESKNYEPVARAAYAERSALDAVYGQIMAIPLTDCGTVTP